jgi:hypothetical protein
VYFERVFLTFFFCYNLFCKGCFDWITVALKKMPKEKREKKGREQSNPLKSQGIKFNKNYGQHILKNAGLCFMKLISKRCY